MESIVAYRVNFDPLRVGDLVGNSKNFYANLTREKQEIEELFDKVRPPAKPTRFNAIYVFKNLEDAKNHFFRKESNHYLYRVEVLEKDLLHNSDWNWLQLAQNRNDIAERESCAGKYWWSEETEHPIIEMIVSEAKVVEEVRIAQSERALFRIRDYEKRVGIE